MHPRNKYSRARPDFASLAGKHAGFSSVSNGGRRTDFRLADFQRQLTCALLDVDFDLRVELPEHRLLPAVPQRLNYLHWIEDLVADGRPAIPKGPSTHGIDIGTGASAIFALLAAKTNGWQMLATDIDEESLVFATANVARNELGGCVDVVRVEPDDCLVAPLSGSKYEGVSFAFCMCNPPFFASEDDASGGSSRSQRPSPSGVCTGAGTEMITDGGEVAFVRRIFADSILLGDRVKWYTSMLGKKSSLLTLQKVLEEHKVTSMASTEFVQGKTRRWGLAWSFSATRAPPPSPRPPLPTSVSHAAVASTAGNVNSGRAQKRKRSLEFVIPATESHGDDPADPMESCLTRIEAVLCTLEIVHSKSVVSCDVVVYHCSARTNTWTHCRRKRRQAQLAKRAVAATTPATTKPILSNSEQMERALPAMPKPVLSNSEEEERTLPATPKSVLLNPDRLSADPVNEGSRASVKGMNSDELKRKTDSTAPHRMSAAVSPSSDQAAQGQERPTMAYSMELEDSVLCTTSDDSTLDCDSSTGSQGQRGGKLTGGQEQGAASAPILDFSLTASRLTDGDIASGATVELQCDECYSREVLYQVFLYFRNRLCSKTTL